MKEEKSIVVLTGGTGYLGSHILTQLLEKGYEVRLTTRNPSKTKQENWVMTLVATYPNQLTFFKADLEEEGSFDEAIKGADFVVHAASPFQIEGIKDAKKELIDPAVNGTENVLNAVDKSDSVKKVVLTSSIAAVYGDAIDIDLLEGNKFTESDWNTSSSISHQPYSFSKVSAERAAWSLNKDKNWGLVTINPGFILGPSVTNRVDSTSIRFMLDMLRGKFKFGVPALYFSVVDVRDVAQAHVLALEKEGAIGRHICTNETLSVLEIGQQLNELVGDNYKRFPKKQLPNWLAYIFAPILAGFSWNYLRKNLGIPIYFENNKVKQELGLAFRDVRQTLSDHLRQIEKDGLLK